MIFIHFLYSGFRRFSLLRIQREFKNTKIPNEYIFKLIKENEK